MDDVVPITVEVVSFNLQLAKFLGRDLLACRIAATIEARAHDEPAAIRGVANQVDDRLVGAQRAAAPVDRDEREQAMLHLVPLARPGWEVADVNGEIELVGDSLQLLLPYVGSITIAAARVGGDEDRSGLGVALHADLVPPRFDRCNREYRRVVVDPDAHESIVCSGVVHAVWDCFADCVAGKVVDVDEFRLALRLPLKSPVLEIADQLLLLRIDGADW